MHEAIQFSSLDAHKSITNAPSFTIEELYYNTKYIKINILNMHSIFSSNI